MAPLDHLVRLTDGCGIWQHARHVVPDRRHGYCLDDVARGLWLCARRVRLDPGDPVPGRLAAVYASFVDHAWEPEAGRFRNFLTHDRQWVEERTRGRLRPHPRGAGRDGAVVAAGRHRGLKAARPARRGAAARRDVPVPPTLGLGPRGALGRARPRPRRPRRRGEARPRGPAFEALDEDSPGPTFEAAMAYDSPRLAQGALDGAVWVPGAASGGPGRAPPDGRDADRAGRPLPSAGLRGIRARRRGRAPCAATTRCLGACGGGTRGAGRDRRRGMGRRGAPRPRLVPRA